MRIIDCVQGSPEWLRARIGRPTASGADRLLTPKTRKPSESRYKYRVEILTEWLLGVPLEFGSTGWMERGQHLEAEARSWYAMQNDCDVQQVGFVERDDGLVGCSPDGLVGDDGMVEIKVLSAMNHVAALLGDTGDYNGQAQFQMYVCGRQWNDVVYYNPVIQPMVVRVKRDEAYISALVDVLDPFVRQLESDKLLLAQYRVAPTERNA